jgi:hypothetical protein
MAAHQQLLYLIVSTPKTAVHFCEVIISEKMSRRIWLASRGISAVSTAI